MIPDLNLNLFSEIGFKRNKHILNCKLNNFIADDSESILLPSSEYG